MAVENEVKKSIVSNFDYGCANGSQAGLDFGWLKTTCPELVADKKKEHCCSGVDRLSPCVAVECWNAREKTREKLNELVGQIANRPLNFGKMY